VTQQILVIIEAYQFYSVHS